MKAKEMKKAEMPSENIFYFQGDGNSNLQLAARAEWGDSTDFVQKLRLDTSELVSLARRDLDSSEADWLQFALGVYGVDRLASRWPAKTTSGNFCRRILNFNLLVSDPDLWNLNAEGLEDALGFLTGDQWHFSFGALPNNVFRKSQVQFIEQQRSDPPALLFSGGLDSLAGAQELLESTHSHQLLISGHTHSRLKAAQEGVVNELRRKDGHNLDWVSCEYGLKEVVGSSERTESSQRTRGWMHVALGLSAAKLRSQGRLRICENGIGAFNLSSEISQKPNESSRSVHPLFLAKIEAVARRLLSPSSEIISDGLFETKGQLLSRTFNHEGKNRMIRSSFSCEIFPNYFSKIAQCGVCPSCLVRRCSLMAAELDDVGSSYQFDVLEEGLPSKLRRQQGFLKMEAHVRRLQECLTEGEEGSFFPWEYEEVRENLNDLILSLGMSRQEFLRDFSALQGQFVVEWSKFAAQVHGISQRGALAA